MAVTYEQALALKQELGTEYQQRHTDLKKLRGFWHGRYWQQMEDEKAGLASLFRDIARGRDEVSSPDFKVIHNVIQEVCVKYQTFLSPLPMIRVYVDPPESSTRRRQAQKKERYLYGLWNQRPLAMSQVLNRMAWYLPLMGDCFLGCFPDIEDGLVRPVLRSPEYAYPLLAYDGQGLEIVLFAWETTPAKAARQFPGYNPDTTAPSSRFRRKSTDKVEVLEYSDGKCFARWIGGQQVAYVEHGYGFNLFDQIPFIHVPDEPWNHGAVEQAVSLNEAENVLRSLLLQAVIENVFPRYVLIDPSKAPEELDLAAGAVWGVNAGGDVKTLAPPLQALPVQTGFMAENERAIKQATSMPDVNFGQFKGSIVTGKAINELQGAGTGSTIEMVQALGIGSGIVSWNEKALIMGRKLFNDETVNLAGYEKDSAAMIVPRYFTISIKGSELVGSTRNEVVFLPHMNDHEKLVMGLQGLGAGIWSKEYMQNQLGIPDAQAMREEIMGERIEDIVLGAIEQELMAAPTPETAADVEGRALAYLKGSTMPGGLPAAAPGAPALPPPPGAPPGAGGAPPGAGGAPPGAGGPPMATMAGGGQLLGPALEQPPGAPPPQSSPSAGAGSPAPPPGLAGGEESIALDQAIKDFQAIQVSGQVFLVGEIVDGQTDDDIEVALTDGSDRQPLSDGLPQYAGRLMFHTVQKEPIEPHIEVTPGAAPEQKGEEPDLMALMAAES